MKDMNGLFYDDMQCLFTLKTPKESVDKILIKKF